jgi:very-short-patch-repair endonuclease
MGKRLTVQQFIEKAQLKHGVTYDYSKVSYVNNSTKVSIECKKHGIYLQRPADHMRGDGCPSCKFEKIADIKRSNVVEFAAKSILVHGPIYDYSTVKYTNAITKVDIGCGEHGMFKITPDKHLGGGGCQKCSNGISRGEKRIQQCFDKHNIEYEREKRFDGLCGTTKNSRLRYDFFLPEYNMLLEYDGEQHFYPVRTKGRIDESTAIIKHKATKVNDKKKNKYAKQNGYKLLRISYKDYKNIENILKDIL